MMLEIYLLYTVLAFFATFFAIYKNSPIFFFFAMLFCAILIPTSWDVGKRVCVFSVSTNELKCTQFKEQYPALSYLFLGLMLMNIAMGLVSFLKGFRV
jgi:hypothetical protein